MSLTSSPLCTIATYMAAILMLRLVMGSGFQTLVVAVLIYVLLSAYMPCATQILEAPVAVMRRAYDEYVEPITCGYTPTPSRPREVHGPHHPPPQATETLMSMTSKDAFGYA